MYQRFSNPSHWHFSNVELCSIALASLGEDFPIGISLGKDSITSAYITENDNFVTAANVKTTQAWKDFAVLFFELTATPSTRPHIFLENREYTRSEVNRLLVAALTSIREATKAKLNREIEILGITYPAYIAGHGYIRDLLDVAIQILPDIKDGTQAWPYLHSVRKAYQLDNATKFRYPVGTKIDLEDSLLLQFDYQDGLLEVSVTSIGTEITTAENHFRIANSGGSRQVASPKKLEYLETRIKPLLTRNSLGPLTPVQLSDFKRVTYSGDASVSEFQKIRELITKVVLEFSDRFIENIEPRWAGSIGASRLARKHRLNPQVFEIQEQIYERKKHPHNEL